MVNRRKDLVVFAAIVTLAVLVPMVNGATTQATTAATDTTQSTDLTTASAGADTTAATTDAATAATTATGDTTAATATVDTGTTVTAGTNTATTMAGTTAATETTTQASPAENPNPSSSGSDTPVITSNSNVYNPVVYPASTINLIYRLFGFQGLINFINAGGGFYNIISTQPRNVASSNVNGFAGSYNVQTIG